LLKVSAKTGRAQVSQIIGAIGLRQHVVLGPGHRDKKSFVHSVSPDFLPRHIQQVRALVFWQICRYLEFCKSSANPELIRKQLKYKGKI
jgi:hypothetical protein